MEMKKWQIENFSSGKKGACVYAHAHAHEHICVS